MKTLADAIFEAELHSKKEPKIAALMGMGSEDLRLVEEALNTYRIFGIKKYDEPIVYATEDENYGPFFDLLNALESRELTGNAAKSAVTDTLSLYTERTARALARVLDKDLKCGATISTFKKVYPSLNIPEFDLMGAETMNRNPDKGKVYEWKWPCIGEAKYDGQRAIIMYEGGKVTYWSRNGKPLDHLAGLFDIEIAGLYDIVKQDFIVDGEALANSFSESIKAKGSDNDTAKANLNFYAFDWMLLSEWKAQNCPHVQQFRSNTLEDMLLELLATADVNGTKCRMFKSRYEILRNMEEAQNFYAEIVQSGLDDDGKINGQGEGLIIKYMDAFYAWNLGGSRGPEWTKWKSVIEVDGEIVGFELGDKGTKNENKLGRFHVEGKDENGRFFKSKVGGMKVSHKKMKPLFDQLAAAAGVQFDKLKAPNYVKNKDQFLRQWIWDHQADFMGKMIMIEAQELTLAANATVWSLRFPQFCEVRTDK